MNYLKYFFLIILIVIIGYISYKYFVYKKMFDINYLENLSDDLSEPVFNYAGQFSEGDLTNPEVFKQMIKWIEDVYYLPEDSRGLLNYGYGIKYDKNSKFYLFFLYGEDKKVSDDNISITGLDGQIMFGEEKPSFFKYLFGSPDYDIVLFGYKKPEE